MITQALTQVDPKQFFQAPAPTATGTQQLDTQVNAVAVSNDFAGRLSVTTAEGDKITLTADFEARYQALSYQGQVQTDGGTGQVSAKSIEASLSKQYGVTVEGDLSEQELNDLEKLFRKVSGIFNKYLLDKKVTTRKGLDDIEARVEEVFSLTLQEIKRSGYDGLLPAGMVLTGGSSALPGIRRVASEVLGMPVRTAQPENLTGLVDRLNSPAYSTGVGLLRWVFSGSTDVAPTSFRPA